MFSAPVDTLVHAWNDTETADKVLKELSKLQRKKKIKIIGAGTIVCDEDGEFDTHTANPDIGQSALVGFIGGSLIGLLGGPLGPLLVGLTGSATAGAMDHLSKVGLTKDQLKNLKESMKPGSSAVYAMVYHKWVEEVVAQLASEFAIESERCSAPPCKRKWLTS